MITATFTLCSETEELIKRLNEWKDNVESKGMRVNTNKTKWRTSEGEAEGCKMAMRVCCKGVGSNSLQCTVVRNGYTRNVM